MRGDSLGILVLNRLLDVMSPTMRSYDGKPAILLLSSHGQFRDHLDMIWEYEVVAE